MLWTALSAGRTVISHSADRKVTPCPTPASAQPPPYPCAILRPRETSTRRTTGRAAQGAQSDYRRRSGRRRLRRRRGAPATRYMRDRRRRSGNASTTMIGAKIAPNWPHHSPIWPHHGPILPRDGPMMAPRWPKLAQNCPEIVPSGQLGNAKGLSLLTVGPPPMIVDNSDKS